MKGEKMKTVIMSKTEPATITVEQMNSNCIYAFFHCGKLFTLHKIPKDEKVLVKIIKNASALNKHKCPWINLTICDPFLDRAYVFGREKDILRDLKRIVKMIVLKQECMIGYIGISLAPGRFGLQNFI